MPNFVKLYLQWIRICEYWVIPNDIRDYTVVHFIKPFVKHDRETFLLEQFCDINGLGHDGSKRIRPPGQEHIVAFLKNPMLEWDMRLSHHNISIVTNIITKNLMGFDHTHTYLIRILQKAFSIGNVDAFKCLWMNRLLDHCDNIPSFMTKAVEKLISLPTWQEDTEGDIRMLTTYALETHDDEVVRTLLIAKKTKDYDPFGITFTCYLSKEEANRFRLIKQSLKAERRKHSINTQFI